MMTNTKQRAGRHIDLAHQYGCAASMTIAYFEMFGVVHVARRFWRSDLGTAKIELYTICPGTSEARIGCASSEDWMRYVDEFNPSKVDAAAMIALAAVEGSTYTIHSLAMDQAARYAAIELA